MAFKPARDVSLGSLKSLGEIYHPQSVKHTTSSFKFAAGPLGTTLTLDNLGRKLGANVMPHLLPPS